MYCTSSKLVRPLNPNTLVNSLHVSCGECSIKISKTPGSAGEIIDGCIRLDLADVQSAISIAFIDCQPLRGANNRNTSKRLFQKKLVIWRVFDIEDVPVDMSTNTGQEISFQRRDRIVAGRRWNEGGAPTLALHGWLDNANTFSYLAPRLPELDILALDFAGHGLSDHRPPDVPYTANLDIEDILAIADQAGWHEFNVIGHSMGAEYGSQLAGLFPEKVRNLVCIDGIVESSNAERLIEMRAKRIQANLKPSSSGMRTYESINEMADRAANATGQTFDSAYELVLRGHKGMRWWIYLDNRSSPKGLKRGIWSVPVNSKF